MQHLYVIENKFILISQAIRNIFSLSFLFKTPTHYQKSKLCSKKYRPLLNLPLHRIGMFVFYIKSGIHTIFFHDETSPISTFNINRKASMSKSKIIELDIGESFNVSASTNMKVLSVKDNDTVRLAFNAPKHVKIFTESMYKKLLKEFSMNQQREDESC